MDVDVEGCASRDETSEQIRQDKKDALFWTRQLTKGTKTGQGAQGEGSLRLHGDPHFDPLFVGLCFRDAATVSEWQYRPMLPHGQGLRGRDKFSVCERSNVM